MKSLAGIMLLFCFLHAQPPLLGMVQELAGNRYIMFSVGEYYLRTQPYGVLTLEELADLSVLPSECKAHVMEYYERYPLKRHFAHRYLKRGQLYHIEPRGGRTIIYADGMRSYSELLVTEGLAMRKPLLDDEEWAYRFRRLQNVARLEKRGLWAERIWIDCVTSLYAEEGK